MASKYTKMRKHGAANKRKHKHQWLLRNLTWSGGLKMAKAKVWYWFNITLDSQSSMIQRNRLNNYNPL